MLIQRATLMDGRVVDIRTEAELLEVSDRLDPVTGESVIDGAGRTVIPGLHDHHVHAYSAAAALTSVHIGPREIHGADDLRRGPGATEAGTGRWRAARCRHRGVAAWSWCRLSARAR